MLETLAPDAPTHYLQRHPDWSMIKHLKSVFASFDGQLYIRLWDGELVGLGNPSSPPLNALVLVFHTPATLHRWMLSNDPLMLAEAYFNGEIDIEGDLFALLHFKQQFAKLKVPSLQRLTAWFYLFQEAHTQNQSTDKTTSAYKRSVAVKHHDKEENRLAIQFHYDVSNEFYALWLDTGMSYSSAYYERSPQALDIAQTAKLDLICRKLRLKPGDRFLDIGCGWGALVIHAAKYYGVKAYGVTLSMKQMLYAWEHIAMAGLQSKASVQLQDYRDIEGIKQFDKIASIGMFEHVGINNLPTYFSSVFRLLTSDGLFINDGITSASGRWSNTIGQQFINRYVFPDGQLESLGRIQQQMEHAGFEITDIESMRAHYALTLREWVQRLTHKHAQALQFVSESTYRVWQAYMAASALSFESGDLGLYQVVASKRHAIQAHCPLTRHHLYQRRPGPFPSIEEALF